MSTFILEQLSDEPVVLLTLSAEYRPASDLEKSNPQVYSMLETVAQPVYYIIDPRAVRFTVD